MCGRGTQLYSWAEVRAFLSILKPQAPNLEPQYNIAPTTIVDVVRETDGVRELVKMRWDLIPAWWTRPLKEKKFTSFNARKETLRDTAAFKTAWAKGQRCIVPMNFYEWKRPKKKGQAPYYVFPAHEPFFLMAGLWDRWRNPETGEAVLSCTVITCEPNAFMEPMHDRMPVILGRDQVEAWFDAPPEEAFDMLKPCPPEWMSLYPVSAYVNNANNQGPECVERVEERQEAPRDRGDLFGRLDDSQD
jgi:putative SOS response-associated peptidase YedK